MTYSTTEMCPVCWREYEAEHRDRDDWLDSLERYITGNHWCSKRCRSVLRRRAAAAKAYKLATTPAERAEARERGRAAAREGEALLAETFAEMDTARARARNFGADVVGVTRGPARRWGADGRLR
jgi:hypothetical protein